MAALDEHRTVFPVPEGHARGDTISPEEVSQCVLDFTSWLEKNVPEVFAKLGPPGMSFNL
jgi:hypothetical protein